MTSENKAPERIWAWVSGQSAGIFDTSFHDNAANAIEYVRADLFEASAILAKITKEQGWKRILDIDGVLVDAARLVEILKGYGDPS